MKTYKNFTRYTPDEGIPGVMYMKDEDGNDWYTLQSSFADDTMKIAWDSTGLIIDAKKDVAKLVPLGLNVTELSADSVPDGFPGEATSRWVFDGKKVTEKPLTAEEWQARAEQQRQSLITAASETMTPWEREANAGILDDDDKASLIEWTKYAKALRKLDISAVKDEAGYNAIVWPEKPDN